MKIALTLACVGLPFLSLFTFVYYRKAGD